VTKLRVCPKCGHHDLPIWRNSRFYFNVDVCKISDLEYWESSLAEKIKAQQYYEDGHFAYLLQAGQTTVLRKEIELLNKDIDGEGATAKKEKWFKINVEKHRKRMDSSQTKLLVDAFPEHGSDKK